MRCVSCGICCKETDMLLSEEDITRLTKGGYSRDFFVRFDREHYAYLRNRQGYCVFYNSQKRRCAAYAFRPSGCRIYPVIYDEENGIVVDSICQAQETVTAQDRRRRGKRVQILLEKIDSEAQDRKNK